MILAALLSLSLLTCPCPCGGAHHVTRSVKVLPLAAQPTAAGVLGDGPDFVSSGGQASQRKLGGFESRAELAGSSPAPGRGFFRRHPALTAFVVGAGIGAVIESFQHDSGRRVVVVPAPKRRCDGDD